MKKIICVLTAAVMILSVLTLCVSAETIVLDSEYPTIHATFGTPEIDGQVDDVWDTAEMFYVNIPYSPDPSTPDPICRFRMMYDETYIYILTEVYDCTMGTADWESTSLGGNLWKRDGISFAFDPANDKADTFAAPSFWFIIGSYGNTANWQDVPKNVFISEDDGVTKMFAISYVNDSYGMQTGYIIESKINLAPRCEGFKPIDGHEFGFSIACNDNNALIFSATRNELMLFTTADGINKNNQQKATVVFAGTTAFVHTLEELRFPTPEGVYLEGEQAPVVTTEAPTAAPTEAPTAAPTAAPTEAPTAAPTAEPTAEPTAAPTAEPENPTEAPANTNAPETKATEEKKGCKSAVLPALLLCVIPAAVVSRKKRD